MKKIKHLIMLFISIFLINNLKTQIQNFDTQKYIKNIYKNVSGFSIPKSEKQFINSHGSAVYGEIKYKSLKILLDDLKPSKKDVFYDLGSGVGKVAIQATLDYPFRKTVGVELSETRHKKAQEIRNILKKNKLINKYHNLFFYKQDIAKTNLKDATIIFMCSTCYPENLIKTLTNKFSGLKKGTRILSLKKLYPNKRIQFLKKYYLPMTWSKNSSVYLYKII